MVPAPQRVRGIIDSAAMRTCISERTARAMLLEPVDYVTFDGSDIFPAMLDVDSQAPDFEAPDQHGNPVRLADLRGSWVVLWWYLKASTSG